jgi:hypothetical protein
MYTVLYTVLAPILVEKAACSAFVPLFGRRTPERFKHEQDLGSIGEVEIGGVRHGRIARAGENVCRAPIATTRAGSLLRPSCWSFAEGTAEAPLLHQDRWSVSRARMKRVKEVHLIVHSDANVSPGGDEPEVKQPAKPGRAKVRFELRKAAFSVAERARLDDLMSATFPLTSTILSPSRPRQAGSTPTSAIWTF